MTLVEVLIAIVITFIVFLGLSGSGIFVLNENIKNSLRDEAVSVAEMEMNNVRNTSFDNFPIAYDNVSINIDNVPRQIRGLNVNYGVSRTVNHLDSNNLQVSITVTWTRTENNQTRTYNNTIATIVRR